LTSVESLGLVPAADGATLAGNATLALLTDMVLMIPPGALLSTNLRMIVQSLDSFFMRTMRAAIIHSSSFDAVTDYFASAVLTLRR